MAFNASNLTVNTRWSHENGYLKVFDYTTTDSKNDTKGSSYFDNRFFRGGDLVKVAHAGGSYIGVWTFDQTGLGEI